jgi:hypothetical protein
MKKILPILLIPIILCLLDVCIAYANPVVVTPPAIIIIVPLAPADLKISIGSAEGKRTNYVIESRFLFSYSGPIAQVFNNSPIRFSDDPIKVTTSERSFEITPPMISGFSNVFTLNLDNQTLTLMNPSLRIAVSTFFRIILTLILEGIVFYLFGFRKKWSWVLFILVNVFTQSALNIWLNMLYHPIGLGFPSYIAPTIIVGEFFVFIVELLLFSLLAREHGLKRRIIYVISANLFSLTAGFFLITMIPF